MTNFPTIKCTFSLILLSTIQLNKSISIIQTPASGCGNIPNCRSYKPDPCNTCSCSDPINNPALAMCTLAYCPDPTFTAECTKCIDGYMVFNKRCTSVQIPPALPPHISISPPCICAQIYAPVCCSDGQTYSNQCSATCNGLKACKTGECSSISDPISPVPVDPIPISLPIEIEPVPPALPPHISISPLPIKPCLCAQIYAPVCCSDGQTYPNQCSATCNRLNACKTGECSSISDPILPCKYVPICSVDPCEPYYNYNPANIQRVMPGSVECEGYPNARCETKIDCNGCNAIFSDEFGNEIKCIKPAIKCQTDVNCRSWEGFYCRPDIKCSMGSNIDPSMECNKVCWNSIGLCNVNDDCSFGPGYECIEGFCVKYQENFTPIYVIGRPYNINKNLCDLKAMIKEINCNEYKFYFNDIEYSNGNNISINNNEIISDWIERGLSEHAAIGTFAKFNLDLMSIGAPLWFLEMANNASLDEIRHTKITFDIVNMYIKHGNNNNGNNCIFYNDFPMHNIEIDGNYNRISLDAANGGCFGETLSVFITYLNGYNSNNNKIINYLYIVSIDEIRHASLSWVTVKWIMDKKGKLVQVYDINWWKQQLEYLVKNSIDNNKRNIEQYVYKYVIPSIFELLWLDNGDLIQIKHYNELYHSINSLLKDHLDIVVQKIIQ